jgi:hypothetical protein
MAYKELNFGLRYRKERGSVKFWQNLLPPYRGFIHFSKQY